LDADKEGYLRSRTSLIQTIGRAARNVDGRALLYADKMTKSMTAALEETGRRRERQLKYNAENGITPESVKKNIHDILESVYEQGDRVVITKAAGFADRETEEFMKSPQALRKYIDKLKAKMIKAAEDLEFEEAAHLRDEVKRLEQMDLFIG
ncbi:MAG TPA: UvrB/UvrC motif-containing protein, partial [Micavibrio sp.]